MTDVSDVLVRVRDLRKSYGSIRALDGISFRVSRGDILGFLGPNGAGKTTAMKLITGFLEPAVGAVVVAGHDVGRESDASSCPPIFSTKPNRSVTAPSSSMTAASSLTQRRASSSSNRRADDSTTCSAPSREGSPRDAVSWRGTGLPARIQELLLIAARLRLHRHLPARKRLPDGGARLRAFSGDPSGQPRRLLRLRAMDLCGPRAGRGDATLGGGEKERHG